MMKKRRSILSPLFIGLVLLFMYLPIVIVVLYSFNSNPARSPTSFTGFTLEWYRQLFQDARGFGSALMVSLELAVYSCLLSVVIGTLGAVGLCQNALRGKRDLIGKVAEGLTTLPIMIPEVVLGMALMVLFYAVDIPLGMGTLVLAHTTFCIPYILIVVKGRIQTMDPALSEAARDLGATPMRVLWDITLPLVRPAIISGAFLALAMSMDDFVISFFVSGVGAVTLPVKIYSSVKTGVSPQVNALCTLMLAVVFIAVALSQWLGSRKNKPPQQTD